MPGECEFLLDTHVSIDLFGRERFLNLKLWTRHDASVFSENGVGNNPSLHVFTSLTCLKIFTFRILIIFFMLYFYTSTDLVVSGGAVKCILLMLVKMVTCYCHLTSVFF